MLHGALSTTAPDGAQTDAPPRRVLMTVDAVGGVWRYAVDAARGLNARGIAVSLVGLGPAPLDRHRAEVAALADATLDWLDEPLDWMVSGEQFLARLPSRIGDIAARTGADLVHLNVPSQAADLALPCPMVTVAHSCVATWWRAVRGTALPRGWAWQTDRTRAGLLAADAVMAPSQAHAAAVEAAYGPVPNLHVVPNAAMPHDGPTAGKEPFVFAAGRWWDDGKNARTLDGAAVMTRWPVRMAGGLEGPNGERVMILHAEAMGELPAGAVRSLMSRAAIVASPSVYEPFGLSVLEAALSGAALVLSDIPTYRELWDGAALFATADDPAAHAVAINRLAADERLRADLGRRAKALAGTYTVDRQVESLLGVYRAAALTAADRRVTGDGARAAAEPMLAPAAE